jgi:hypothetical protein
MTRAPDLKKKVSWAIAPGAASLPLYVNLTPKMFAGTKNSIPSVRFPSHHHVRIFLYRRSPFTVLYRPFPVPFGTVTYFRISRILPYFPMFFK